MRHLLPLVSVLALGCNPHVDATPTPIEPYDPLEWVDPFVGTGGLGVQIASINPGASVPFGMVLVGPDTRHESWGAPSFYHCAGYHYEDTHIDGFSHTHAHGMGVTDYAAIHVMPRAAWRDGLRRNANRAAPFDHDAEWASPGTYSVVLQDDDTLVEIAATQRGAIHRYTFAEGLDAPIVLFDLGHHLDGDSVEAADLRVDLDAGEVHGFQRLHGSYTTRFGGLRTSFSATLDPAPVASGTWVPEEDPMPGSTEATGPSAGAWVEFPAGTTEVVMRLAISYVDEAGAIANREAELDGRSLEEVLAAAEALWREELSTVRVRGGTDDEKVSFHTALYHTSLMPSLVADVDGRYRGFDQEIHEVDFDYYTDFSLWDTFRTLHPWYILAKPERQRDMVRSLLRMQEDGGWLPRWPMAHGYTSGMVGTPTDQVLAETYLKGIDGWDVDAAFEGSWEKARNPAPHAGRSGIEAYLEHGYVTVESTSQAASKTLEYAWSDHALARWAEALGRTEEAEALWETSGNWAHTWDPEVAFFRGRHEDGSFGPWAPGQEDNWTPEFVEGNAWHYLYYVPYDVDGMIEVQHDGDREAFLDRYRRYWQDVYDEPYNVALPDTYYWHGNQPAMHVASVGTLAGDPDTTAEAMRWVMETRYHARPQGLEGNDDSGTLSAWFLMASMGVFPVPGTPDYALGSPIFERVEIDRPDGTVVVRAPGVGPEALYIGRARFGDEDLEGPVFSHEAWMAAGELVLEMEEQPGGWSR